MAAGKNRVADPIDIVVYKSVWSPVIGKQLSLSANPHDEFAACGSDKEFSDSLPHSAGDLFTDQVIIYYTNGLCHQLSSIYHITGRRRKRKGLDHVNIMIIVNPQKTALIRDLALIFVIMLSPPATKQDQAFIQDQQ